MYVKIFDENPRYLIYLFPKRKEIEKTEKYAFEQDLEKFLNSKIDTHDKLFAAEVLFASKRIEATTESLKTKDIDVLVKLISGMVYDKFVKIFADDGAVYCVLEFNKSDKEKTFCNEDNFSNTSLINPDSNFPANFLLSQALLHTTQETPRADDNKVFLGELLCHFRRKYVYNKKDSNENEVLVEFTF